MLIYRKGFPAVCMVDKHDGRLVDNSGNEWVRMPEGDVENESACYGIPDEPRSKWAQLNRKDLQRIVAGPVAMQAIITLDEAMYYVCSNTERFEPSEWSRLVVKAAIEEAKDKHMKVKDMLDTRAAVIKGIKEEKMHGEVTEKPLVVVTTVDPPTRPQRPKVQKSVLPVVAGVPLTEKQLYFLLDVGQMVKMRKLSLADFTTQEVVYIRSNPSGMSIGAVVTTLREKGILQSHRIGSRTSLSLTETGIKILEEMNNETH